MSVGADRDKLLSFFDEVSEIPGITRLDVTTDRGVTYTFRASGERLALKIEAFSEPVELDQGLLLSDPSYFDQVTRSPKGLDAITELLDSRAGISRLLERKAELMGHRYDRRSAQHIEG